MTTIAYDGLVLAGDNLIRGPSFTRRGEKVWQVGKNKYFGGCGNYEDVIAVKEWLCGRIKEEPKLEENFAGILIEDGQAYRIEANLIKMPIKEKHHAVGSGASFAIVAMYLGQGAIEAIATTSIFDECTSYSCDYFNVKPIA